ncbi:hypothetical protein [Sphingomonas bacterium]|uniref:hypothetical protein n=1 Tax=Sphingomonas bacterium TaxID=1895847 RepID=UPI001575E033|nr:hypothetical protein [Sphingomonas bacterium]
MLGLALPMLGLVLASTAPAQAQEWFTDPIGGKGGQQYVLRCPGAAVVTGVSAMTGAYINNVAPICDGRTMPGAGGGGDRRSASCPAGSIVDTIDIILLRSPNHLVKALQLFCVAPGTRLQTARVSLDTPGVYTGPYISLSRVPGYPSGTMDCANQSIVGLQGRAGDSVDALGLICRPRAH